MFLLFFLLNGNPVLWFLISLTDALAMYCRLLGIPMLVWTDDMLGLTNHTYKLLNDVQYFFSALRAKVVVSIILFKTGYFLNNNNRMK